MEKEYKTKIAVGVFLGTLSLVISGFLLGRGDSSSTLGNQIKSSSGDDMGVSSEVEQKKLVISPNRCSGCGKCLRIDSEHFAVDASTGRATVISQKNLDSKDLTAAVAMCHDGAITLS